MFKIITAFLMHVSMLLLLPAGAVAADLRLKCEGAILRLGGAYVRNLSLELELIWKSGRYVIFESRDGAKTRIGGGRAELTKSSIKLNNGDWIIDRQSGTLTYTYADNGRMENVKLACRRDDDGRVLF